MIEEIISRNYDPEAFALVDERCLPKTDNIVRFLLEPEFLNQPLYPRQLQIVLDFFAAYCPYCSHTDWLRNKVEVDTLPEEMLDRVTLYKNGICPKCGKTRYDAIKAGVHINYASLVLAVSPAGPLKGVSNSLSVLLNVARDSLFSAVDWRVTWPPARDGFL